MDITTNISNTITGCINVKILLKSIRLQKDLTRTQLSERSGVSVAHIGYIERGEREPTAIVLCRLAKALNVSVNDILDCE